MLTTNEIENIIEEYQTRLFLYCISKVKNEKDAEDLVSEVILKLVEEKNTLTNGNLLAWLFRSVDNLIKRYYKKKYRNVVIYIDELPEDEEVHIKDNEYIINLIDSINEDLIKYIKNHLSGEDALLFLYRYENNMNIKEVANVYSKAYGTVYDKYKKLDKYIKKICFQYYNE